MGNFLIFFLRFWKKIVISKTERNVMNFIQMFL